MAKTNTPALVAFPEFLQDYPLYRKCNFQRMPAESDPFYIKHKDIHMY